MILRTTVKRLLHSSALPARCNAHQMPRRHYWTPVASPPTEPLSGGEFWLLGGGLFMGLLSIPYFCLLMVPVWAGRDEKPIAEEEE